MQRVQVPELLPRNGKSWNEVRNSRYARLLTSLAFFFQSAIVAPLW